MENPALTTHYTRLTVQAATELNELASLLRWRQTQMVGALDGSQFVRETWGARRESVLSEEGMMGEDSNDILDPEYNNDTD